MIHFCLECQSAVISLSLNSAYFINPVRFELTKNIIQVNKIISNLLLNCQNYIIDVWSTYRQIDFKMFFAWFSYEFPFLVQYPKHPQPIPCLDFLEKMSRKKFFPSSSNMSIQLKTKTCNISSSTSWD